jgi:hypothetical protein
MNDKIVESVVNQMIKRSEVGFKKYGKTLEREDYSIVDWINEAQQEALDLALYLERIKQDLIKAEEITKLANPKASVKEEEVGRLFIFDR